MAGEAPITKARRAAAVGLIGVGLVAAAPGAPSHPVERLLGSWDNAAQFAAAPLALKRPPAAGAPYPWLDRQHARFALVDVPAVAGPDARAVHVEWRAGGPEGPVSRRRVWVFRTGPGGRLVMDFYSFTNPEGVAADAGALVRLAAADLIGYGPLCALAVETSASGFVAEIPETCTITARSGRTMRLSARIVLEGDALRYEEAGRLPDGTYAFLVPGGGAYRFVRVGP